MARRKFPLVQYLSFTGTGAGSALSVLSVFLLALSIFRVETLAEVPPELETENFQSYEKLKAQAVELTQGALLYKKLCAQCHGSRGKAPEEILKLLSPAPSDLSAAEYRYGSSEKTIAENISQGRGLNMFRFDNRLSSEQIIALAKYLRTLQINSKASPN